MIRHIFIILIILLTSCGGEGTGKKPPPAYKAGEVLVKFRVGIHETQKSLSHNKLRAGLIEQIGSKGLERVKLPEGVSVAEAIKNYEESPDVEYAEPNYIVRTSAIPDDPRFGAQWGLYNTGQNVNGISGTTGADIGATGAWDTTKGSSSVVVAVIDTGVDGNHPDISANLTPGYDFIDNDNDPDDLNGHGTHVSGIIGAAGNNSTGVSGVNWFIKIMPLKVLDNNGEGTISDIIKAIEYAAKQNVKIVNMSFAGNDYSKSLYDEIKNNTNILFVAAAGNGNEDGIGDDNDLPSQTNYPAGFDLPNIISVAATDQYDNLTFFSNYGLKSVDVAAPGENILSTIPSFITGITYSGKYEVVYFSFGFEGIDSASVRNTVMQRVLDFEGVSKDKKILLVDDDGGDAYETFYIQALQTLGYQYDSYAVPYGSDGPDTAGLSSYKIVIWFTGDTYTNTLTSTDQVNLKSYLDEGGTLFITGQDIGYDIGLTGFYHDYLHAAYVTDDANGTSYTGVNEFNGSFIALPTLYGDGARNQISIDAIEPADSAAAFYIHYNDAYQFFDGTSMSTPMVSGVAALLASYYSQFSVAQIKGIILLTVDKKTSLQGKILTGGRINAFKAITSLIPPSLLQAALQAETGVILSWTDNSSAEEGFKIERKEAGGNFKEIASVSSGSVTFTDNGVKAGKTYTYRVKAFNDVADSQSSNEADVQIPGSSKRSSGGGGGGGCSIGKADNYQTALADTLVLFLPLVVVWMVRRYR